MRRLIQIGVVVAALGLIMRTWLVEGLVDPLVVSGGSMVPAVRGAHCGVTCSDCGFVFACGQESLPARMLAVCPNCGAQTDIESLPVQGGERLIVDRAAYSHSGPERWDIAVLRTPDDPRALCVKRVVGLPGETVEIREGDVYINGRLARRSLRQLLAMAIAVHDEDCRPTSSDNPRWRSESESSRWRLAATGFACSSDRDGRNIDTEPDVAGPVDWLIYEHEQTVAGGRIAHRVGPILDDLAYNQGESRELMPVPDVILQCRVDHCELGRLWLLAHDGRKEFQIMIDTRTGGGELRSASEPLAQFSAAGGALDGPAEIVLALADAQLRLTLGGEVLVDFSYDPAGLECRPSARPLAIGWTGSSLSISGLKVLRDVYYLESSGRDPSGDLAPRRLGEDEYWLLGDNSSLSVDSRSWPAARANLFIGKVLIHRPGH